MAAYDAIVIGGGMAGVSFAAAWAGKGRSVLVLEREAQLATHSTGRSAALYSEAYGNAAVRALSAASRKTLFAPPASFSPTPFVSPRGVLHVATAAQVPLLEEMAASPDVARVTEWVAVEEAYARCPILKPGYVAAALAEPGAADVDVDALFQAYRRRLLALGGEVRTERGADRITPAAGGWEVVAGGEAHSGRIVVDAAGAWADVVAQSAGLRPLGLTPCRRTALLVDPPAGLETAAWPMIIDAAEEFYFKPDAGRLLVSPADETPCEPCDAQAEEWDVAVAVDRLQAATTLEVRRVSHRWAGLRTFAPDRTPVAGFDAAAPGFFWLAGQGGYGIQTAPALSEAAAALAAGEDLPPALRALGVTSADLSPARFA